MQKLPKWKDISKIGKILVFVVIFGCIITLPIYSQLVYGDWEKVDQYHPDTKFICAAWLVVGVLIERFLKKKKVAS